MTEAENEMLQEIRLNVVEIAAQLKERCPAHQRRVVNLERTVYGNGNNGLKMQVMRNEEKIDGIRKTLGRFTKGMWAVASAAITACIGAIKAILTG